MILASRLIAANILCSSTKLLSPRSLSACVSQDNNNPNNVAYWRSRGLRSRPENWQSRVTEGAIERRLQAVANDAASRTSGERAADKARTAIIVEAVKASSLGSKAQVHKAGSQSKRTNVATSDLDLWVAGDEPVTRNQRKNFGGHLMSMLKQGGHEPVRILLKETSIRIEYRATSIDIVFDKHAFSGKVHPKPAQRFINNPRAAAAVRLLKARSPQKFKGEAIEKAVLAAQSQEKKQSLETLAVTALLLLATKPQVKELAARLAEGKQLQLPGKL